MHYLTNYYKNLCEQLQERINFLKSLLIEESDETKNKDLSQEQEQELLTMLKQKYPNMIAIDTPRKALYRRYPQGIVDRMRQTIQKRAETHDESPAAQEMYKSFHVPDYSDESIDRPIYVMSGGTSDDGSGTAALTKGPPPSRQTPYPPQMIQLGAHPLLKGFEADVTKEVTQNTPLYPRQTAQKDASGTYQIQEIPGNDYTIRGPNGRIIQVADIYGHEITHTLKSLMGMRFNEMEKPWPRIEPSEFEGDSSAAEEAFKRREYTQNPMEVPARFSSLKHLYYNRTGKVLDANMTPEEAADFENFVNTEPDLKDDEEITDVMNIFKTEPGKELFRRTVRRDKPKSDTRMA